MLKTFDEVFDDYTKYGTKIKTEQYHTIGSNIIIDQGQSDIAGYTDQTDGLFTDVPVIIFGDHTRIIKYINRPFFLGADGTKILKSKLPNANYKYLYYALKNAKIPNTGYNRHFKWLKQISILYPEYQKQRIVVEILDKLEDSIDNYNTMLRLLDKLVKARFIEMFKSVNDKVTIGSLCDVTSGYSFKSKDINSSNGIKLLQIGNVFFDNVNWETVNYLPDGYNIKYSKFLLNEGDIVVALTRPIIQSLGNVKACVVRELDVPCLLNQRVGRITPKKNIDTNLKFIYECLMMNDFTKYVESCCIGCSQPNISVHDIENYLVPNVSFKQQERFMLFKKQVDKSRFDIKKSIIELEREVVYD